MSGSSLVCVSLMVRASEFEPLVSWGGAIFIVVMMSFVKMGAMGLLKANLHAMRQCSQCLSMI